MDRALEPFVCHQLGGGELSDLFIKPLVPFPAPLAFPARLLDSETYGPVKAAVGRFLYRSHFRQPGRCLRQLLKDKLHGLFDVQGFP